MSSPSPCGTHFADSIDADHGTTVQLVTILAKVADYYLNKLHGRPTPPLSAPESVQVGAMTGTGGTRAALNAADSANRN